MRTRVGMLLAVLALYAQPVGAQTLSSHVDVSSGPPTWSYTVFNDEPAGSEDHIKFFALDVQAPITVTGTPAGWNFDTDGMTFVLWFNEDPAPPYPNDIAPGTSLGG